MLKFIPPKSIQKIQKDYNLSPDTITEEQYAEVKELFEQKSSDDPLISVVIIAYNEEKNLFKTLVSLSKTDCKYPIEFIVVNNNSTDRTQQIIDRTGVRTLMETQQGYPFARQAGNEIAKGKYIISGDADTLYPPKWAELMVRPMEKDEKVVCTYSLHAFYTADNKYPASLLAYQQAKTFGVHFRHLKRPHLNCGGASMAYRAETAKKVGGYNLNMVRGTDGYIAYQMLNHGKVVMVPGLKAMIYTSMRRTELDGSLGKAFINRSKRYVKNIFNYLTPQKES